MKFPDSPALRIGAWRVDPTLDAISKDGTVVKLERRAMQLLVCLAEHAGEVVSVDQLLDQVWAGVVVTPDSVYQAVAALRRLLGDDTKEPTYIANVRRRGYRLIAPVTPWVDGPRLPAEPLSGPVVTADPTTVPHPTIRSRWRRYAVALSIAVVMALGYVVIDRVRHLTPATTEHAATVAEPNPLDKSIAVLPFVDMSEKHDQEYFSDGLAEELLDRLSKTPGLRVIARTSSFYFKGKQATVTEIGRTLGVANVLEGSVRKSGNRLRVTTQLVRTGNGEHLWSETYDRELRDLFQLQDDIAGSVVKALRVTLAGGLPPRQGTGTEDLEAYQLYLRSSSEMYKNTRASLSTAERYAEESMRRDPNFVLAIEAAAFIAQLQADNDFVPAAVGYERTRRLALQALAIDPNLAEPHALLGYVHLTYDWDWKATATELQTALSRDPTSAMALKFDGFLARTLGQTNLAEQRLRASLANNPLDTFTLFNLGFTLYIAGRFQESEHVYRTLLDIEPNFSWTRPNLAMTLIALGRPKEALAIAQQEPEEETRLECLAIALDAAGKPIDAENALQILSTKYGNTSAYYVAMTYANRGDVDRAMKWLERAYKQRDPSLVLITGERLFRKVATDPRYKAFLHKMNVPE
jgi:TolB-like protein/DNA-binding winged helix-turn-helix (wHTH) protein/tetratricopeptide (TPR) repeat protein